MSAIIPVTLNGSIVGYAFECPGCDCSHWYPVPRWTFNGDLARPTFTPSLLNQSKSGVCHLFLTDGVLQFCVDCTHPLAGKSVPLNAPDADD